MALTRTLSTLHFQMPRIKRPGPVATTGWRVTSPNGTLFELAINGLTAGQGTDRLARIGADLAKICGSHHQRRTCLAQPICGSTVAAGKGAESGDFGLPFSG